MLGVGVPSCRIDLKYIFYDEKAILTLQPLAHTFKGTDDAQTRK